LGLIPTNGLRVQVSFVAFAAGGQHEEHTVLRSPASPVRDVLLQDVGNKNSTEPKEAKGKRAQGKSKK